MFVANFPKETKAIKEFLGQNEVDLFGDCGRGRDTVHLLDCDGVTITELWLKLNPVELESVSSEEVDIEEFTYNDLEDMCEEMLNECHEALNICGYITGAGSTLKKTDPIAFRQAVVDWADQDYVETPYGGWVNRDSVEDALSDCDIWTDI